MTKIRRTVPYFFPQEIFFWKMLSPGSRTWKKFNHPDGGKLCQKGSKFLFVHRKK